MQTPEVMYLYQKMTLCVILHTSVSHAAQTLHSASMHTTEQGSYKTLVMPLLM